MYQEIKTKFLFCVEYVYNNFANLSSQGDDSAKNIPLHIIDCVGSNHHSLNHNFNFILFYINHNHLSTCLIYCYKITFEIKVILSMNHDFCFPFYLLNLY